MYRDYSFLKFVVLTFVGAVAFFQFLSTIPLYYKDALQLNENTIGLLLGLNGFLVAVFEMPAVYILERRGHVIRVIALGTLMIGVSLVIYNISPWVGMAVLGMALLTVGEVLTMPFSNALSMQRADAYTRGRYLALYALSYSVAFIVAPVLGTQIIAAWGFDVLWYTLLVICMAAAFGFYRLEPQLSKPYRGAPEETRVSIHTPKM